MAVIFNAGFATEQDIPDILALWTASFGDPEADIRAFLDTISLSSECLLHKRDGRAVSMVFLLPAELVMPEGTVYPVQYIYAAATLPDYRGQGLFGNLLQVAHQKARERGQAASFLRPGEPSLFRYYQRFGYRPYFTAVWENNPCPGNEALPVQPVTAEQYVVKRNALLSKTAQVPYIRWDQRMVANAVRLAEKSGGGAVAGPEGCALVERLGDTAIVREHIGTPAGLADLFPAGGYRILRMPGKGEKGEPIGLLCPLSLPEDFDFDTGAYMGFTLE